jgi:hypothetical protein
VKLRANFYVYVVIMAILAWVIGTALSMEKLEDKLLPLIFGGTAFVIAGIGSLKEYVAGRSLGRDATEKETEELKEFREHWRSGLSTSMWIVSFFVAVWLLGFLVSIPIFVISYMKSHRARWHTAILYGCVTLVAVYGIFEWALEIKLYRGLLLSG